MVYFIENKIDFSSSRYINLLMAVVVYWLITAGCGPAKGSSIEAFCEKDLAKRCENLPDRPINFIGGAK